MNDYTKKKCKSLHLTIKTNEEDSFFIADEIEINSFRLDPTSMEHPFFALKNGDKEIRTYQNGNITLRVIPSALGLPTIFDKDIFIYILSKAQAMMNNGVNINEVVYFSVYDFLKITNRKKGGKTYSDLKKSLNRLAGARFETNLISSKNKKVIENVGFIDSYKMTIEKKGNMDVDIIKVTLPKWLLNVISDQKLLKISSDYFRIRKAIDRRIYELARKHCGNQKEFIISLDKLLLKSGSLSDKFKFKFNIKELTEKNDLPDYEIFLDVKTELVTFKNRNYTPKLLSPPTFDELKQSENYHLYESILFAFECLEQKKIKLTEKEIDFLNGCKNKFEQTKELKLTKKQEEYFFGIHSRKGTLKNKIVEVAKEITSKKVNKNNDIELQKGSILIGSVTKNEYKINEHLFILGADYIRSMQDGLSIGVNDLVHIRELIDAKKLIIKN